MTFRLWSLNRLLRVVGFTITVQHPGDPSVPTVVRVSWIGWGAMARAADDERGEASGYERDEVGERRYMRCLAARDAAWDDAVMQEYGS